MDLCTHFCSARSKHNVKAIENKGLEAIPPLQERKFQMGSNKQSIPLLLELVVAPWVTTAFALTTPSSATTWDGSHRTCAVY